MGSIMEKQCKKGDLRSVKRLVQNGLDVNYSDAVSAVFHISLS